MSGKKLRFAVIGTSGMAKFHMNAVNDNPYTELVALCDIHPESLPAMAKEFNVSKTYTDYKEMYKDADLDGVIVCTPDFVHEEMTVEALKAGINVLCEKPMALTAEECARMVEASKKYDAKMMVGQICRYTPAFKLAKKLIEQGEIGELYAVESEYAHDYKYASPGVDNWRRDPKRPREGFIGGGCHAVDLLRWIAGDPTEVVAYANHKCLTDWPVNDATFSIMKFPNDVIGKVFVSIGCKREYTMRSVFSGTKGTIICNNTDTHLTIIKEDVSALDSLYELPEGHPNLARIELPVQVNNHNTHGELDEFVDCIINETPIKTTAEEGASTVAVCLAAVESAKTGNIVKVAYPEK